VERNGRGEIMSQCKRGDKKSLASRTIFKYMDMGNL
jgi:hypothetical protein